MLSCPNSLLRGALQALCAESIMQFGLDHKIDLVLFKRASARTMSFMYGCALSKEASGLLIVTSQDM